MSKTYFNAAAQISGIHGTPQNQPIPGSNQVKNDADGYSWAVDNWTRLRRFLGLGSEEGNFYATEQKLTQDSAKSVQACLAEDGERVVREIVEFSTSGKAIKNDPCLFALALAISFRKEIKALKKPLNPSKYHWSKETGGYVPNVENVTEQDIAAYESALASWKRRTLLMFRPKRLTRPPIRLFLSLHALMVTSCASRRFSTS